MSDILGTLSYVHCVPEGQNSIHKLLLIRELDFTSQKLMPKVFYRVQVGQFRGRFPPVDVCFNQEPSCQFRCVLRIVILHESMMLRKQVLKKWHKCAVKDAGVQWSIHFSFKNAYSSPPSKDDPRPDVNFHRMLSPAGREISSNVLYVEHRATALVNCTSRT